MDGETNDGDDKRDPHEGVKAAEDVIESLEPVPGGRRADDVLAIVLESALDARELEADGGVGRIASVDVIRGNEMDVYGSDGVRRVL